MAIKKTFLFLSFILLFTSCNDDINKYDKYYIEYLKLKEVKNNYSFYDYLFEKKKELDKKIKYNILELDQCSIPIRNNLTLIEKDKNNYIYIEKESLPFVAYSINVFNKNLYETFFPALLNDNEIIIVENEYKGYKIIEVKNKGLEEYSDYYIFGENISVHIFYGIESEVKYIVNYCIQTMKE